MSILVYVLVEDKSVFPIRDLFKYPRSVPQRISNSGYTRFTNICYNIHIWDIVGLF